MTLTNLICENIGQELPLQRRSVDKSELEAIAQIYLKLKLLKHSLSPKHIDANCLISTIARCLRGSGYVNLVIAGDLKN